MATSTSPDAWRARFVHALPTLLWLIAAGFAIGALAALS
jgi:hypothetical protein